MRSGKCWKGELGAFTQEGFEGNEESLHFYSGSIGETFDIYKYKNLKINTACI